MISRREAVARIVGLIRHLKITVGRAGVLPDNECFRTPFDGCTFDAQQAIGSVKSKLVCRFPVGGDEYQVYSISRADKNPSLLVFHVGRGSGGEESDLEIRPLMDQAVACDANAH